MKRILVNGAGGFIGGHMVKRLKAEGFWVRAVDLKRHEYAASPADEFIVGDLRDQRLAEEVVDGKMRSTSLPPTWAEPVISSPVSTMPMSCITPPLST
jgi:uncharacterized protein YbjT (DUF2867 family)